MKAYRPCFRPEAGRCLTLFLSGILFVTIAAGAPSVEAFAASTPAGSVSSAGAVVDKTSAAGPGVDVRPPVKHETESGFLIPNRLSDRPQREPVWYEARSEHFVLFYQRKNGSMKRELLERAEASYGAITNILGYNGLDSVWLWEDRCVIYLYSSAEEYRKYTGRPAWSSGFASIKERVITSYEGAPDFLDGVLPHEMTHLVFRDYVGSGNRAVPLWLEEGVAMVRQPKRREEFDTYMRFLIDQNRWIPMDELFGIRTVTGQAEERVAAFYAQSQSVVHFLLEIGSKRFESLCRHLRDGVSLEEALSRNYPVQFPDIAALEKRWLDAFQSPGSSHQSGVV